MLLSCCLPLIACTEGPNHVGNPLTLPVRGVLIAAENAGYNARRRKVETYVSANHAELLVELDTRMGPKFKASSERAGVPVQMREAAFVAARAQIALISEDPDALVVVLMVHAT